ncbi:MAG: DNA/pantothenate metabolism flavoprotein domain protein [Verrucomicrobia bacterium]|nr:DNA/pantothenate metabolism flavoprotein domain protein [Verrucomicrobiota bacterium]
MRCLVTAGPTWEPVDKVRRLTNFSTGRLATELALFLQSHGHEVELLRGEASVFPAPSELRSIRAFSTTESLADLLRQHASMPSPVDAIFHASAVSDFKPGKVFVRDEAGRLQESTAGKHTTREGTLMMELEPTQKILPLLRSWFPRARIVGWKYEIDGGREEALSKARRQLIECRSDACVVNGPAYGPGFGILRPSGALADVQEAQGLFSSLRGLLEAHRSGQGLVE